MRLVDTTLPYRIVYSIYHHEYFAYLVTGHVVQELPNGTLSLVHQGLYPDNMEQFAEKLDDKDRKLVKLISETHPRYVVKHFGGDPRDEHTFYTTKLSGELEKLVQQYIHRRLAKILPQLTDRHVFTMGKDGYPAQIEIQVLDEQATVLFHFKRRDRETIYYPTIKLHGELLKFQFQGAKMICLEPAWMLLDGELFTFKQQVEGKKIRAFFERENIRIPKEKEVEYFQKFVLQIVEKYKVLPRGFEIHPVRESPSFSLQVVEIDNSSFCFKQLVHYGEFRFELKEAGTAKAIFERDGDDFTFYRIERDEVAEKNMRDFFEPFTPNLNSLTPWEYVEKEAGLAWLSKHGQALQQAGVEIVQESEAYRINLGRPRIEMEATEAGDWFDVKAMVHIGNFLIPFIKFRQHILRSQREYKLPDGTVAILPEEWFSDFRHLLEVSQHQQDDTLRLKKYQAPLLNLSQQKNNTSRLARAIENLDEIPATTLPTGLNATLRQYQARGYDWLHFMKEQQMGCILADDMGLGKTLQTLALLLKEYEEGNSSPSLIVLPTSLIYNWKSEAEKFAPDLKVYIHTGVNRSKNAEVFAGFNLILTTYGIVRQDISLLKDYPFHYVVLDESQTIKNPDSKTAKAIRKLVCSHKLSLTGTPIENTVMDIWSQMTFLNPGLLGSEAFFKKFYVIPIEKEKDAKRSAKLRSIIYPFILRRRKDQVERELPPKVEQLHYCEMTPGQREFYEETRNTYRNYLMELITQGEWKKNKLNILTGLQKLRQIAIHPKMVDAEKFKLNESGKYLEMKRLLMQVIEREDSKVLIFSQFVKMLQLLKKDLDRDKIRYNYLDGSTKDRQAQVDTFQEDKNIQVFLISLKAGGVGLNLTAADYVFILDPWWNPAVESQAIDRSHRIGQKRTVFYYKFITEESIEEKILNLQRQKAQLSDDIIQVEEDMYKSLDAVDLQALL